MTSALIKQRLLSNKDSNEVIALLGQPDNKLDMWHQWKYNLGGGVEGWGFRFDYLTLTYKQGRVVNGERNKIRD